MPPDGSPFSCPCGDPLLESLRPLLEPSLCLARDGQLPHANAATLASGELAMRLLPGEFRDVHHAATLSRALFQRAVSWALFSEQWLDALASLLKACGRTRVLELAAGAGVLAAPMRRRGLVWRTTDQKPAPDPTPTPIPNPALTLTLALALTLALTLTLTLTLTLALPLGAHRAQRRRAARGLRRPLTLTLTLSQPQPQPYP